MDTPIGRLTSVGGYGEVNSEGSSGVTNANTAWNEELRLASAAEGSFSWIAGAYYRSADLKIDFMAIPLATNEVKNSAVFGRHTGTSRRSGRRLSACATSARPAMWRTSSLT